MIGPGGESARRRRAVRGAASAAVATVLAATAHTIGGGLAPAWLIAATVLLVSPLAVWLVGRAPSLRRTGLVVVASQGFFHAFFAVAGAADPSASVVHQHAASASAPIIGLSMSHPHVLSVGMASTHLIAAALTVAVLALADRAVDAVRRGIRRIRRFFSPAVAEPRACSPTAVRRRRLAPARRLRSALSLRGPPVTTA
ncbi:MAG: hypothetical protein PGN24_03335 [Microbacterium arborescens]